MNAGRPYSRLREQVVVLRETVVRIGGIRLLDSTPVAIAGGTGAGRISRLSALQVAFFYVAVPVLISMPLGWFRTGPGFSLLASIAWWSLTWMLTWALSELFSRFTAAVLKPWRPPLWAVLALGALINMAISSYYQIPLVAFIEPLDTTGLAQRYAELPRNRFESAYLLELLRSSVSGVTLWVVANYLFEYTTRVPRFPDSTSPRRWMRVASEGGAPPSISQPFSGEKPAQAPEPQFFGRLKKLAGLTTDDLLAVEAQDHFIRIHAAHETELLLYRFRDAVRELAPLPGAQIHRSFWVARHAVERVDRRGRAWHLVLRNGLRVPVSQANRGLVETLANR